LSFDDGELGGHCAAADPMMSHRPRSKQTHQFPILGDICWIFFRSLNEFRCKKAA